MLKRKMAMFDERESYGDGNKWFRGPKIGKGSTCCVFESNLKPGLDDHGDDHHKLREKMAVKSTKNPMFFPLLKGENTTLKNVHQGCPYIVECLGFEETVGKLGERAYNLLLEHGDGGTLRALIRRNFRRGLPEEDVRIFTKCIAKGLHHIHARGYMHRDLRPDNIILVTPSKPKNKCTENNEGDEGVTSNTASTGTTPYIAKICDLGCAKDYTKTSMMNVNSYLRGEIKYLSPEAAVTNEQGPEGDVWALGCMVFEMLTGDTVWRMASDLDIVNVLVDMGHGIPHYGDVPGRISNVAIHFMEACLQIDPRRRLTAEMLLELPFIKGV